MFNYLRYEPMSVGAMLDHTLPHVRDMAIVAFAAWLVFGLPLFFLLLWLRKRNDYRFRLRRSIAKPAQMGREFFNTTRSLVIYFVLQVVTRIVAVAFGFIVTFDHPLPLWEQALAIPLIVIAHDAWFYWTHRIMHAPALFHTVHLEHHKSLAPTIFTAYSFSPIEAMVQGSFLIVYVAFLPCDFTTIIVFYAVEILYNVMVHSGVDLFPRFLVVDRYFGWVAGTVFHDIHHATGRMNYGLYTRFWDRVMKTEHPDFVRIFNYVHSPENDGHAYRLLSRKAVADTLPEVSVNS